MFLFAHPEAVIGKPEVYKFLHNQSTYMYVAVDEAHCILDWGHEFRPIFRDIKQLRAVRPDARFLALSATVSINGISDITKFLAYIHQIGRAGRSGIEAEGVLYVNNSDIVDFELGSCRMTSGDQAHKKKAAWEEANE
uniref:DNA 3'-5' helicase n=1 Tax=Magallana gigas TaxID=29159 RepID=K1QGY6_MAGGI